MENTQKVWSMHSIVFSLNFLTGNYTVADFHLFQSHVNCTTRFLCFCYDMGYRGASRLPQCCKLLCFFLSIIYLSSTYHLYHLSIYSSYLCGYCLSIYIPTQLLTYQYPIAYILLGNYDSCTINLCLKTTEIMYILINFVILKINITF